MLLLWLPFCRYFLLQINWKEINWFTQVVLCIEWSFFSLYLSEMHSSWAQNYLQWKLFLKTRKKNKKLFTHTFQFSLIYCKQMPLTFRSYIYNVLYGINKLTSTDENFYCTSAIFIQCEFSKMINRAWNNTNRVLHTLNHCWH